MKHPISYIPYLQCPADSSFVALATKRSGDTSYSPNGQAFVPNAKLSSSIPDGLSSTICLTEHFGRCGMADFSWSLGESFCFDERDRLVPCKLFATVRSGFADPGYQDVKPVYSNVTRTSTSSVPQLTFQVRPTIQDCDPRIPQSGHVGGIVCSFFDGSVRLISHSIRNEVFWSLVTLSSGEVVSDF